MTEARNLDDAFKVAVTLEANQKNRNRKNEGNVEQHPSHVRQRVRAATYVTSLKWLPASNMNALQFNPGSGLRNYMDQLVRVVGNFYHS